MRALPKITIEAVSPEMAATMLGTMTGNRTLRKKTVERYAREMLADKWLLNGESVKLDVTGRLVDGQHRLNAVIMAKRPVMMCVVRGVDGDAMITLDTGVGRSFADWSTIGGRSYGSLTGAVARWWHSYEVGSPTHRTQPSHQELEHFVNAHPSIVESCSFVSCRKVLVRRCVASVQTFVHAYASEKFDRDLADLFMNDLDSGSQLVEGSPILALRRRLVDDSGAKRPESTHILAWTIKAWNAWLAGETLKKVSWVPGPTGTGALSTFPRFEIRKAQDRVKEAERVASRRRRLKVG